MVASEGNGLCREAQYYYHDFLRDRGSVPTSISAHIDACAYCRAQVRQLEQALCEAEEDEHSCRHGRDETLIAELQSHFEHLGEPLACGPVKPFLPGLLTQRIRIPTPITVHIDRCDRCSEDLDRLASLGLTAGQLARLGRLYAGPARAEPSLCRQVRSTLETAGSLWLEDVPETLVAHICFCSQCRDRLYQFRQELFDRSREIWVTPISCDSLTISDVFDLVVPYGRVLSDDGPSRDRRTAIANHVLSCVQCMARVQDLHRTIYGIAERPDCGVVTTYKTAGATAPRKGAKGPYRAYPIDVSVACDRSREQDVESSAADTVAVATNRPSRSRPFKPVFEMALLVAVVIPLAIILVVSSRPASGLSIRQINKLLLTAENVRVLVFGRNRTEPLYEVWVSRPNGILAQESPQSRTVVDLFGHRGFMITPSQRQRVDLAAGQLEQFAQSIRGYLEFDFEDLSPQARLEPRGSRIDETGRTLDLYEVSWFQSSGSEGTVSYLLRLLVDPADSLPRKAEFYRRHSSEQAWAVESTSRFDYPDNDEVRRHFEELLSNEPR
jgi:hypothetical protein